MDSSETSSAAWRVEWLASVVDSSGSGSVASAGSSSCVRGSGRSSCCFSCRRLDLLVGSTDLGGGSSVDLCFLAVLRQKEPPRGGLQMKTKLLVRFHQCVGDFVARSGVL